MPDDNPTYDEQVISAFSAAEIYAKSIINVDSNGTLGCLAVIIEHLKSIDLRYTDPQTQIICGNILVYIIAMFINISEKTLVQENNTAPEQEIIDTFSSARDYANSINESSTALSGLATIIVHLKSIDYSQASPKTQTICRDNLDEITTMFTDISNEIINETMTMIFDIVQENTGASEITSNPHFEVCQTRYEEIKCMINDPISKSQGGKGGKGRKGSGKGD